MPAILCRVVGHKQSSLPIAGRQQRGEHSLPSQETAPHSPGNEAEVAGFEGQRRSLNQKC